MSSVNESSNCLRGYRLALWDNNHVEEYLQSEGAEILHINLTIDSEGGFTNWWRRQVDKARHDRVTLAVLDNVCDCGSEACQPDFLRKKWLEKIEEEELYSNDDTTERVRFTKIRKVSCAIDSGKLLEDVWGDYIEKGEEEAKLNHR